MSEEAGALHVRTVAELARGIRDGEFTASELTEALLERIRGFNESLNAFITVTGEQALARAAAADRARKSGSAPLLNGVPIVHKDLFCTAGALTTCGSRMLANFVSPYDATVVERLKNAGAVTLGKTNMDEFAMGSSNETSWFGPVANPWDMNRSPGGSSGGSAAAVAARLIPAATGTDTGGSIRQPAALTGTVGLKPTYGRVSRHGMVAFASSLDQAGVITRSAEDAAILLGIIAGFDERDSTCLDRPVPDYVAGLGRSLKGLKIGVVRQHFDEGLDPQCASRIRTALDLLRDEGASLQEVDLPNLGLSVPTYYVVAPAECSSNMSRFDGVRFGYRADNPEDLLDLYCRSRGEGFGAEVRRRILTGTYVLSAGYYDAYYLKALKVRRLIRQDFDRAFGEVDLIAGPITAAPAFKLGEMAGDPLAMYLVDLYTVSANLAGIPGLCLPCGRSKAGLPIGLQLQAPALEEERLLRGARMFEQVSEWHTLPPNL